MNDTRTRLTVYKDSRNHVVYKIEVYTPTKSTRGRRVFTEISSTMSNLKGE